MSESITRNRPGVWWAQLWKETYQVWRSGTFLVIGGFFALQWLIALGYWLSGGSDAMVRDMVLPCLLAPTLVAVACSGMLIGHERESRSWEWAASLPQSWMQVLCLKFLICVLAVLLCAMCLVISPAIANILIASPGAEFGTHMVRMVEATVSAIASLLVFSMSVLWFRESLVALVAGTFASLILQCFTALLFNLFTPTIGWVLAIVFWIAIFVLFTFVFEWRWGVGQQFSLAGLVRASERPDAKSLTRPKERHGPRSELAMMLSLVLRQNLVVYGAILAGVYIVTPYLDFGYLVSMLVLATCILGVFTFSGDQPAGRYRFWADRGASAWKFVLCKIMTAAVCAFLMSSLALLLWQYCRYPNVISATQDIASNELMVFAAVATGALFLSALSSLVFPRGLTALAASVFLVMATTAVVGVLFQLGTQADLEIDWLLDLGLYSFAAFSLPLWLIATFRLSERWIGYSDPRNVSRYTFAVAAGFIVPATVAVIWGLPTLDLILGVR